MKYNLLFITLVVFLSGCATPPGKLTDSDFIIEKYSIETAVPDAVSSFYEGLRYCGEYSGGVMGFGVTHHGIPDCAPIKSDGMVVCDLYVGGAYGGRSNLVLGRVDFMPNKNGTSVELRVQSFAANKDNILKSWKYFIANESNKVCPQ